MDKEQIRLQLFMARCGIASRRKCEEIISQARISVNGNIVITPGTKVFDDDIVKMDGRVIRPAKKKIYLALHKPSKFLCSNEDPDGRSLAIDLISPAVNQRVYNVGRLDYLTSGLIFFTNDGEFAKKITHPSSHIEKEYVVTTKKEIPLELMENFKKGIYVGDEFFKLKTFKMNGSNSVNIVLEEGKNRELRKVFQSQNINVKKVHRIRIGNVKLTGLNSGHFRNLTEREVKSLTKSSDAAAEKNKKTYKKRQRKS
ncbi:MAG: rRNA pseudouridine synthase [Spirochaetaceae bacterium]|nr:rRNA pseudouridine synthase [Spirochaetaceae bacterium]